VQVRYSNYASWSVLVFKGMSAFPVETEHWALGMIQRVLGRFHWAGGWGLMVWEHEMRDGARQM